MTISASTGAQLTRGQFMAADRFLDFLHSDAMRFAISGTAGTGKTFLMGHLASRVMDQYRTSCKLLEAKPEFTGCVFTATTNKAAEVLGEALGHDDVRTIHSFLNLKVKENHQTGKTTLDRNRNWAPIRAKIIVFIDECSMVDQALYAEILAALPGCKLVFVGDHAQMAPVGEQQSAIYEGLDETTLVTLTEPVRNAGQPALVSLCAQLRDTVETGIFHPIRASEAVHYLDDEDMADGLNYFFKDLDPSCRVLCYTNSRVQTYNDYIREKVRGRPPEPVAGDVMVLAQAYARGKLNLSVETELEVISVGSIEDVSILEQEIELEDLDLLHRASNYKGRQLSAGPTIRGRDITVRRVGSHHGQQITLTLAENREDVTQKLKEFSSRKAWSEYFALKGAFADLRHKAACTVYKAQGSTYDAVFVDIGNIGTSYDAAQVARMLFVAISRARSAVYLYGTLPPRYHDSKGKPLWTAAPLGLPSSTPSLPAPASDSISLSPA